MAFFDVCVLSSSGSHTTPHTPLCFSNKHPKFQSGGMQFWRIRCQSAANLLILGLPNHQITRFRKVLYQNSEKLRDITLELPHLTLVQGNEILGSYGYCCLARNFTCSAHTSTTSHTCSRTFATFGSFGSFAPLLSSCRSDCCLPSRQTRNCSLRDRFSRHVHVTRQVLSFPGRVNGKRLSS